MTTARKLQVAVSPIPEGFHTVTTCLTVKGADAAIEFYKKAFGAVLLDRMNAPDGKTVVHASLKIGDSIIFLGDEIPGFEARSPGSLGASSSSIYLYVKDADAAFRRAVEAGGVVKHEPGNMFWGDRCGTILDPFGFHWDLATHVEDVPPEEMRKRGEKFMAGMNIGGNG